MHDLSLMTESARIWFFIGLGVIGVAYLLSLYFVLMYILKVGRIRKATSKNNIHVLYCDAAYFKGKGKRKNQEDSLYISPISEAAHNGIIFAVSDGMGGLSDGQVISRYVTERLAEEYPYSFEDTESNAAVIRKISDEVYEKYRLGGGATLAMIHIYANAMNFYSLGDSNIILVRKGTATVLNPKQNYISFLVKKYASAGDNTHEAYINKSSKGLMDFVGNLNSKPIRTRSPIRLMEDDVIIICSDGVTDAIPVVTVPRYTDGAATAIAEKLKLRIRSAKRKRQDNYTAIVIKMDSSIF
ncbi:MAG: protein phosphatase 2C domain-containing protein [Clostridiales bacterium]|nr:protein phosphatase 2C domain-containing protein [Clostridiales bacterium]